MTRYVNWRSCVWYDATKYPYRWRYVEVLSSPGVRQLPLLGFDGRTSNYLSMCDSPSQILTTLAVFIIELPQQYANLIRVLRMNIAFLDHASAAWLCFFTKTILDWLHLYILRPRWVRNNEARVLSSVSAVANTSRCRLERFLRHWKPKQVTNLECPTDSRARRGYAYRCFMASGIKCITCLRFSYGRLSLIIS